MKILEKPLVKTIPVSDTLTDIFLEVNHAAGEVSSFPLGLLAPDATIRSTRGSCAAHGPQQKVSFEAKDDMEHR